MDRQAHRDQRGSHVLEGQFCKIGRMQDHSTERRRIVVCRFRRIAGLVSVDEQIYGIGRGDGLLWRGF